MACIQVMIAYLALEVLLAVVSGVETLADAVNNATKPSFEQLQLAPLAVTASEQGYTRVWCEWVVMADESIACCCIRKPT